MDLLEINPSPANVENMVTF